MFQLDAVEKLGPIIVKMARQEFRKVKQSSGGMESVSFFKEFKEGADNLYVLSSINIWIGSIGRVHGFIRRTHARRAQRSTSLGETCMWGVLTLSGSSA